MKINLLGDFHRDSGIEEILIMIYRKGFTKYFQDLNYGEDLNGVAIICICQNPELNLKQRIRYSKKEKFLYMDLMFDLPFMIESNVYNRQKNIESKIVEEVPKVISKYKFKNFDADTFKKDMIEWFQKNGVDESENSKT